MKTIMMIATVPAAKASNVRKGRIEHSTGGSDVNVAKGETQNSMEKFSQGFNWHCEESARNAKLIVARTTLTSDQQSESKQQCSL